MKTKLYSLLLMTSLALVPACENPALAGKLVKLGELGLVAAAVKGDINPGDVVTIQKGVAIIKSSTTGEEKLMALADLGVEEAITRGDLSPGDTLLIREATAILKEPTPPPVGVLDLTSTK